MGHRGNVKHYWWQVNWGVGVLLAGGWSLPVLAVEVLPEPVIAGKDPAPLLDSSSKTIGAIAPAPPVQVLPELLPPSVTPLKDDAVTTPAVNPGIAAVEGTGATSPAPVSTKQAPSAPELSGFVAVPAFSDRFEPEFAQTVSPNLSANELAQGEASGTLTVETSKIVPNGEGLIVQAEGEAAPLSEEATQLEQQADTVLDNDEVPAGDLLESVDGLEDSGIAGEGAITDPAPEINSDDELTGEDTEAIQTPEQPLESTETEAENLEADSEDFDSEDFEAEDFDFDEDEEAEAGSNSAEATEEEESEGDPDLGVLRLRERPLAKQKPPLKVPVFLVGNVGYIGNGNTLAGVDPVNDRLFRSGLSLIASPRLSKRTALIASVQGNLYRYDELSRLDYNEVRLQTSLRHVLTRKVYGDVGWTHRQLFLQEDGDRFLHEHAAFASLTRRDPLTKKTSLTSFYNLRAGFADPETSSRLRNTLGLSLRHDLTPALQASLTGRMTLTNFTQQYRQDFYTQGLAQLSYKISKNVRLSAFGSLTRGNSSNRRVDFDNSTVGVSLSGNVKLF